MTTAALITIAATGIGLIAGSIQVLDFLQKQRERRAGARSPSAAALPSLPPAMPDADAQGTVSLAAVSPTRTLPPRDHFSLSSGDGPSRALPSGTVTLLFTDIVGSTHLWQEQPAFMATALARHDTLLHAILPQHHGYVFKTVGDAFYAVFATASDGIAAALAAQQALCAEPWPADVPFQVRMGLHSGAAEQRGGDYFGPPLNRLARMLAAGHGGQVLVSEAA